MDRKRQASRYLEAKRNDNKAWLLKRRCMTVRTGLFDFACTSVAMCLVVHGIHAYARGWHTLLAEGMGVGMNMMTILDNPE